MRWVFALLALLWILGCAVGKSEDYYLRKGNVYSVDTETDVVIIEDAQGNLWEFQGVEDWQLGDSCRLLMDGKRTMEIEDDIIVRAFFEN